MRYFHHLAIAALLAAAPLSATSAKAQTSAPAGGAMSSPAAPANHMSGSAAPSTHHPVVHHKKVHVVSKPGAEKVPQPVSGGDPGTGDVKH